MAIVCRNVIVGALSYYSYCFQEQQSNLEHYYTRELLIIWLYYHERPRKILIQRATHT